MTSKLTITRERIELIANFHRAMTLPPSHDEIEELARMALAAMDSEPVAWVSSGTLDSRLAGIEAVTIPFVPGMDIPLFRHPVVTHDGDFDADPFGFARRSGDLVVIDVNGDPHVRDGMPLYRHAQPAQVVMDEAQSRAAFEQWCTVNIERNKWHPEFYAHLPAREQWAAWEACRAAMLQHQPQNAQQNIPENIPGGLVEAVNNLLNNDGSRGCYDAMECGTAREKIELWLAQRQRWEEQRKANLYAGNSPVIPGRWIPVSERMPETDGNYWGWWSESKRQGPVWFIKSELQAQFQSHEITHWMPLPAAPQEVKGEHRIRDEMDMGARITSHRFKV